MLGRCGQTGHLPAAQQAVTRTGTEGNNSKWWGRKSGRCLILNFTRLQVAISYALSTVAGHGLVSFYHRLILFYLPEIFSHHNEFPGFFLYKDSYGKWSIYRLFPCLNSKIAIGMCAASSPGSGKSQEKLPSPLEELISKQHTYQQSIHRFWPHPGEEKSINYPENQSM